MWIYPKDLTGISVDLFNNETNYDRKAIDLDWQHINF